VTAKSRRRATHAALRALLAAAALVAPVACGGRTQTPGAQPSMETARRSGERSKDAEEVGKWALYELVAKGGDVAKARDARARLDKLRGDGMYASLARAIADGGHGHLEGATNAYLAVVRAARSSRDPRASLVAWFATNHLLGMAPNVAGLWEKAAPIVEDAIARPGSIGWRARGELVSWWTQQAFEAAKSGTFDASAERHGCLRKVRLSGPFGHDASSDRRQVFEAERPGPWPQTFPAHPSMHLAPHVLPTERHGCQIRSTEPTPGGIFYAETFVDLPVEREVIVAAQGAFRLSVDDTVVLDRDTRVWGVWGKFTVQLRLPAGRHRLLARIGVPETSFRLMQSDGTPLGVESSDDPRPLYSSTPPVTLGDPNVLDRFVRDGKPVAVDDDLARYLGSFLAHVEEEDDVASVILEPLVSDPAAATPFAQALAAVFAEKDPIFPDGDRHDLARDLRQRAAAKDPELWWPRFWLALDEADKKGLPDAVEEARKLAEHFRDVPEIPEGLAQLYGKLNWTAERSVTLKDLAQRFPRNPRVLQEVLEVLEDEGRHPEADRIAARLKTLDPDSEIEVDRALSRHDYRAAIAELKRLGERRPDRKDITDRIVDVTTRSGDASGVLALFERLVAKKPRDPGLRLALADAKFAAGDRLALRHGIADAILAGGSTAELTEAVDLVEGTTELEPYRLDGAKIVREYDTSGAEMEGTAARVLDYSSVWIHPDGSSRMLEHELIRIQSQEAIGNLAEQRVPDGLLLRMRVIKKDGTILEPEVVDGKKTVTMPHLEIGDYIETENISYHGGDGQLGRRYLGPHWFFREKDVGYWRSEFVVISPKDKQLVVETRGEVPPPQVREDGSLVVRRWRVDRSPAAPDEPASAPIQEFLPSVRIGWGISLGDHLRRLTDAAGDELPRDPRIVRIASQIVAGESSDSAKARKLYRWLLANVEDGRESDGRRVVVGKSGNRASGFMYLCRTLGIPVELAATKDKLNPLPLGPISEAEQFDDFIIRIGAKFRSGSPCATSSPLMVTCRRGCAVSPPTASSRARRAKRPPWRGRRTASCTREPESCAPTAVPCSSWPRSSSANPEWGSAPVSSSYPPPSYTTPSRVSSWRKPSPGLAWARCPSRINPISISPSSCECTWTSRISCGGAVAISFSYRHLPFAFRRSRACHGGKRRSYSESRPTPPFISRSSFPKAPASCPHSARSRSKIAIGAWSCATDRKVKPWCSTASSTSPPDASSLLPTAICKTSCSGPTKRRCARS